MRLYCCFPLAILAVLAPVAAQEPGSAEVSLSITTRMVLVPVVATRADGSTVDDLSAAEFQVFDNGKLQRLASFELMDMTRGKIVAGGTSLEVQKRAMPSKPHSAVILLDALNTEFSDQAFARNAIEHLLDEFPAGERIALFALRDRLLMLHDFSSDPAAIRAALRRLSSAPPRGGITSAPSNPYSAELSYSNLAAFSSSLRSEATRPDAVFFQQRRILQTLEALSAIAKLLQALPGQKDLLWVSSGFPLSIQDRHGEMDVENFQSRAESAARDLSSAGVRVYPIDARGLTASPAAFINIATMQKIAGETGGVAFYNRNDLGSLMRHALDDSREGYLVTYNPAGLREDGSFHTIRVRVARPHVKLRYRPGYYAETAQPKIERHK